MNIRNTILGAGVWMLAAGASALSLGGSRGQVTIGAPVDLLFEIQPDAGTDVAASCVSAQVVAGDVLLGDARVRVTPVPESRGRPAAVRVQTTVVVDEPVLTVTLSAGCSGKTTRTYTFLSELPTVAARSGLPVDIARLSQGVAQPSPSAVASRAPLVPAPADSSAAAAPSSAAKRASSRSAPDETAKSSGAGSTGVRPAKPKAAPTAATPRAPTSRLVVEPLDTWLDTPMLLRSDSSLSVIPDEQPSAQRAQAAALWKALNIQAGDVDSDAERVKALEGDLAAIKAQAERERVSAAQLQEQLAQVQNERFSPTVVYALAGLLAMALAAAVWAALRMRHASDKAVRSWRDSVNLGSRDSSGNPDGGPAFTREPADAWLPSDTLPQGRASASDDLGVTTAPAPALVSAPAPLRAAEPVAVAELPRPPAPGPAPALHMVNPEELFDIQQQAEFFISVGEHQQAIEVLKNHIADHRETSPLAYLELLRLYHTLSRVDEFSQLRGQFMQSFNARVPEFASFNRSGRALDRYNEALAEIEAQWTSESVVPLLEGYLFRENGAASIEPFDLSAYDDLLLLLAIAQTTPPSLRGAPPPRKRTTPHAAPRGDTAVFDGAPLPSAAPATQRKEAFAPEMLAAGIDFDFDSLPIGLGLDDNTATSKPLAVDSLAVPLDLDLSDTPHITLSDLPPVPVTSPPASGQPIGFGMDNELMELKLELAQRKKGEPG